MTSTVGPLTAAATVTAWTLQPLAVAAVVLAGVWYWRGVAVLRRRRERWSAARSSMFGLGLALVMWTTCGFPQVYARALFATWVSQMLALLLVIPAVLMAGQPVELEHRLRGSRALGWRFLNSGIGRALGSPLVGPAIIPIVSAVLFFGPLPGWAIGIAPVGWVLELLLGLLGSMIVLPLVSSVEDRASLAVGLAVAVGFLELLLDAVPGIVLRLNTHLSSTFFDYRAANGWAPTPVHDQQWGGGILWGAAEALDLPFLILVFRQWLVADEREAAQIDTVLDAERIARGAVEGDADAQADAPWWLTDEAMRERMRRRGG